MNIIIFLTQTLDETQADEVGDDRTYCHLLIGIQHLAWECKYASRHAWPKLVINVQYSQRIIIQFPDAYVIMRGNVRGLRNYKNDD